MREIKLKRLVLDNFKGTKHAQIDFDIEKGTTTIVGKNGAGKSSLYDAVIWTLFDKMASGTSATDIRPHDEKGNVIHHIEISVVAAFIVDGREIEIQKKNVENWTTKRGTTETKLSNNENLFWVNGIPKNKSEYKSYINDNFCDEAKFLSCVNAQMFFSKSTKDKRAKLMEMAGDFTNEDVIAKDNEFESLRPLLLDGTIEQLITRSNQRITLLKTEQNALPTRIDEVSKRKVDIDVAELELQKNAISEQIAEIDSKLADNDKLLEESRLLDAEIYKVTSAMDSMKNEFMAKQDTVIREHNSKLREIESKISYAQMSIEGYDKQLVNLNTQIDANEKARDVLTKQWKDAKERVFDENSLVCSFCGQEYPQDKKDQLRADFESHKVKEIESITAQGMERKEIIADLQNKVAEIVESKSKVIEELAELQSSKDNLGATPQVDTSDNYMQTEEFQKLLTQKNELESKKTDNTSIHTVVAELNAKKNDLNIQLLSVAEQIGKSQNNVDIDERIAELEQEQKDVGQKLANEQKTLDLLERFNKTRLQMLTDSVNGKFKLIKWVLWLEQLNGGYKDVCQATVGGSAYETTLNTGNKILADIDLLTTFQELNDLNIVIFVDNAEALDTSNTPISDRQLVLLEVADEIWVSCDKDKPSKRFKFDESYSRVYDGSLEVR